MFRGYCSKRLNFFPFVARSAAFVGGVFKCKYARFWVMDIVGFNRTEYPFWVHNTTIVASKSDRSVGISSNSTAFVVVDVGIRVANDFITWA